MKHSNFKRFLCLVLAFCLILPYCVVDIRAAEETVTTISHRQTTGDINYFTFSPNTWEAGNENHVWSKDPGNNPQDVWYTVTFTGHAIEIYSGMNRPMGYVAYYIDGKYVGEFDLYQSRNFECEYITKIEGLAEGKHVFKAVATGKKNTSATNDLIDCSKVIVYSTPVEEVSTEISHTQTSGDSNYFTFSAAGWEGSNANHTWTGDTTNNHESVWYTVDFVGHAIDIYAGKNWPMGYVAYYIDDVFVGEFDLYQSYNSDSLFITRIEVLTESAHTFKAVATG